MPDPASTGVGAAIIGFLGSLFGGSIAQPAGLEDIVGKTLPDLMNNDGGGGNWLDGLIGSTNDVINDTGEFVTGWLPDIGIGNGDGEFQIGDLLPALGIGGGEDATSIFEKINEVGSGIGGTADNLSKLMQLWALGRREFDTADWADDQGKAMQAYMNALYPGTNVFERLANGPGYMSSGAGAITGAMGNIGAAGIQAAPGHKQANMKKELLQKMKSKLSAEAARAWELLEQAKIETSVSRIRKTVDTNPQNAVSSMWYLFDQFMNLNKSEFEQHIINEANAIRTGQRPLQDTERKDVVDKLIEMLNNGEESRIKLDDITK